MKISNISDAKASLSKLVEHVRKGNEVILAKAGKPVAKIVPYEGPRRRKLGGSWKNATKMADDFDTFIPSGFDDSLDALP